MTATAPAPALQVIAGTHACACSGFVAVDLIGTERSTGCTATTKRTFAPGHDARLKGFLIRVGAEGLLIRTPEGGDLKDAMTIADRFGFGTMVVAGIKAAQNRAFARLIRDTKKSAKATHETPKQVTCKVGRWTYEGVITDDPMNGPKFTYTSAKGVQTTTPKFTKV